MRRGLVFGNMSQTMNIYHYCFPWSSHTCLFCPVRYSRAHHTVSGELSVSCPRLFLVLALRHLRSPPDRNLELPPHPCAAAPPLTAHRSFPSTGTNRNSNHRLVKASDCVLVGICLGLTHSFDPKSPTSKFLELSQRHRRICCCTVLLQVVPSTTPHVDILRQPLHISIHRHLNSAFCDSCQLLSFRSCTVDLCVVLLRQPFRTSLQCREILSFSETVFNCS